MIDAVREAARLTENAAQEAARLTEGAAQFTDRAVSALADKLNATVKSSKVSYANGDHYEGQTREESQTVRHGYGVYQYKGGIVRYEGDFVDDEKHGSGTMFFEGGDCYEGQWCRDLQHGRGATVHWTPQGGIWAYSGEFQDGERNGYGALLAHDRGALVGLWEDGSLIQGVEITTTDVNGLEVALIGEVDASQNDGGKIRDDEGIDESASTIADVGRSVFGSSPAVWSNAEAMRWLKVLGVDISDDRFASTLVGMTGAHLLSFTGFDDIATQCQASQAWRSSINVAQKSLRKLVSDVDHPLHSWSELQSAVPSIGRRTMPYSEIWFSEEVRKNMCPHAAVWRSMALELLPLPLILPMTNHRKASASGAPQSIEEDSEANSTPCEALSLAAARAFVQDLEALASARHPNIRTVLGIVLSPLEEADTSGYIRPMLVYESSKGARLLFEWIHLTLPDGSRQPMDFRLQMRVCIGILEGLLSLASRGLVFASLCSVNVELMQTGSRDWIVRLAHAGGSWWRWGWKRSLQVRESGQPRRRALGMEEVVKRYAICPVNWLAPEVLMGQPPDESGDIYGLGMVLWEMLYRTVPFGDFAIASVVAAVGYGRRTVRSVVSQDASTETTFLHEVVRACTNRESSRRPSASKLLTSLQENLRAYEKRRGQRSTFEKLGDKTETLASGLLSGSLQRSFFGGSSSKTVVPPKVSGDDISRMVRLDTGEWVEVDSDLVEQHPGDEEKWRSLMAFRGRMMDA